MARIAGILLAAGAGTRMGAPKSLVIGEDGVPWVERAARLLLDVGCDPVLVVLGAAAERSRALLPADSRLRPVVATEWSTGLAASLRAGIEAAADSGADAALITLVDLPRLPRAALDRVARHAAPGALRQAHFDGRPGHPVLVGADHFAPLLSSLSGDAGARSYLVERAAEAVECGDLGDGDDVDVPPGRRPRPPAGTQ